MGSYPPLGNPQFFRRYHPLWELFYNTQVAIKVKRGINLAARDKWLDLTVAAMRRIICHHHHH